MNLLKPGNGNQKSNRRIAIKYIVDNILDVASFDYASGNITTNDSGSFHVSAYTGNAAFVSTPGTDKSKYSIYESGLPTLMFRQLERDERSFIYEVNPVEVVTKPNSSTAEWEDIDKVATRVWICTEGHVKVINRTKKHSKPHST